jgi:hypothetical protein
MRTDSNLNERMKIHVFETMVAKAISTKHSLSPFASAEAIMAVTAEACGVSGCFETTSDRFDFLRLLAISIEGYRLGSHLPQDHHISDPEKYRGVAYATLRICLTRTASGPNALSDRYTAPYAKTYESARGKEELLSGQ